MDAGIPGKRDLLRRGTAPDTKPGAWGSRKEHIEAFREMGSSDQKIKQTLRLILKKTAKP